MGLVAPAVALVVSASVSVSVLAVALVVALACLSQPIVQVSTNFPDQKESPWPLLQ
jgi:hypothetical protein